MEIGLHSFTCGWREMQPNITVKARPSATGTSRKRAAPYLARYVAQFLMPTYG